MAVRLTRGRFVLIGAGAVAAGLLVPTAASAATAKVNWGNFDRTGIGFNTMQPGTVTVKKGDKVTFDVIGFHTVTLLGRGAKLPPLFLPSATLNPAQNDPAGVPYWWAGTTPLIQLNGAAAAPAGGTTYNGRKTVNSGVLPGNAPKFTVTFPKVGTFTVRCVVHPRMKGKVRVLPTTASDTAAKRKARAAKEQAAQTKTVQRLVRKADRSKGPVVAIGPGNAKAQAFSFHPADRKVAPGSTVTFRMAGGNEVHTVTFGPKAYVEALAKAAFEGSGPTVAGEGFYPSDPPTAGIPSLQPTSHGNGFLNSGLLADTGTGIPAPKSFRITFPTAGTYDYICLVHTFMRGKITVG
jgi:plastocyanin